MTEMRRTLGVGGAALLGLGSIVGTGVFVSIGLACGIAGPSVIPAIVIAAGLASCNALSSAQLAASHPVSGGTYAYGYRYLSPTLGFVAGWMFLCAKSASAATAALGCSSYVLRVFSNAGEGPSRLVMPVALAAVVGVTMLVLCGVRRANWLNAVIVLITLGGLGMFVLFGVPSVLEHGADRLSPMLDVSGSGAMSLLHASALMFVAYTGYGRIATMGEEIKDPARSIPRAIVLTLVTTAVLYGAVGVVLVSVLGADAVANVTVETGAPLEAAAAMLSWSGVHWCVTIAAIAAMLGVLLNLVLGLSRVALAMGREGDLPRVFGRIGVRSGSPDAAVVGVGLLIAMLVCIGDLRLAWSFSAFTVLVYYALTNLAALQLRNEDRRFPRAVSWAGLLGCLSLAFFVELQVWLVGLGVLSVGVAGRLVVLRWRSRSLST